MKATQYFGMVLSFKLYPVGLVSLWIFTAVIIAKCQVVITHSLEITSISHALHIENRAYYLMTQQIL